MSRRIRLRNPESARARGGWSRGRARRGFAIALAACATLGVAGAAPAEESAPFVLFGGGDAPATTDAVHPITAPYFHEDSFVTTDVRAWFAYHDFPANSPVAGGDAQIYAAQARVALTPRFQFVAYKDGYTNLESGLVEANDLFGYRWTVSTVISF